MTIYLAGQYDTKLTGIHVICEILKIEFQSLCFYVVRLILNVVR